MTSGRRSITRNSNHSRDQCPCPTGARPDKTTEVEFQSERKFSNATHFKLRPETSAFLKSRQTPSGLHPSFAFHRSPPIIDMVDVHDGDAHTHKRTAIPQLLNPVTSPIKRQEEHGFSAYQGAFQRPNPTLAVRFDPARPGLSPAGPATFNLRAADWGRGDSSPPSTVHYASSPDTNGSVRGRSTSHSTYDSGPRSNDGNGYIMTTSYLYTPTVSNSPSPAIHPLQPTPVFLYPDGRAGKYPDILELIHHRSMPFQGAIRPRAYPNHHALTPVFQPRAMLLVKTLGQAPVTRSEPLEGIPANPTRYQVCLHIGHHHHICHTSSLCRS